MGQGAHYGDALKAPYLLRWLHPQLIAKPSRGHANNYGY
jgi:hypothetical protein